MIDLQTKTGNYAVHVAMENGAIKAFTNIKQDHLEPFCSLSELQPYEPSPAKVPSEEVPHNFEECMDMGGVITDAHSVSIVYRLTQTKLGNYAIHVVMPNGYSKAFTNLTAEHLSPYLKLSSIPTEEIAKEQWTVPVPHSFEECMKGGAEITGNSKLNQY
jgi:hypothetical protein